MMTRAGPQGSRAPEFLSRGFSRLFLLDLFPHVDSAVEGRGQRVPFEDERWGLKRGLDWMRPSSTVTGALRVCPERS
jgi:hypothetical protein